MFRERAPPGGLFPRPGRSASERRQAIPAPGPRRPCPRRPGSRRPRPLSGRPTVAPAVAGLLPASTLGGLLVRWNLPRKEVNLDTICSVCSHLDEDCGQFFLSFTDWCWQVTILLLLLHKLDFFYNIDLVQKLVDGVVLVHKASVLYFRCYSE